MTTPRDSRLPAARVSDLILTETGTDVLVYDETAKTIHTLNDVTASVWRALDGTRTASMVAAETGFGVETVLVAVSRLSEVSLLEGELAPAAQSANSRRAMLKKMGIAAAVPVIISVSAPMAAGAVSCPTGTPTSCEDLDAEDPCCGLEGGLLQLGACGQIGGVGALVCIVI